MTDLTPIAWKAGDVSEALGLGTTQAPDSGSLVFPSVSTDSRTIEAGELFVALKGETFDAHAFIPGLLARGIRGFVVSQAFYASCADPVRSGLKQADALVFPVPDTLVALGQLARYQRLRSNVKVVAITGSNGKTSTRKMTGDIFSETHITLTTQGNFNNEIGLPLTLLRLSARHQWAVVEMGMSNPGEIARLGAIALPDIGIITNTAECHLKGLGTVENVALAKAELLATIRKGGCAILNTDDPRYGLLLDRARANRNIRQIIGFGFSDKADVRALNPVMAGTGTRFTLSRDAESLGEVLLPTPAPFMVSNALAAASAALAAGISTAVIRAGLGRFEPVAGRMNIGRSPAGFMVINDTYNANPVSVLGAISTLVLIAGDNPSYLILGDMLELGDNSAEFHHRIGREAARLGISGLFAHGIMAVHAIDGAISQGLDPGQTLTGTKEEIAGAALDRIPGNAWVLVKGSRGMRMEDVVNRLNQPITGD